MRHTLIAAIAAVTLATPATAEVEIARCYNPKGHAIYMDSPAAASKGWDNGWRSSAHSKNVWVLMRRGDKYEIDVYYKGKFDTVVDGLYTVLELSDSVSLLNTNFEDKHKLVALIESFVFDLKHKKVYHSMSRSGDGFLPSKVASHVGTCD